MDLMISAEELYFWPSHYRVEIRRYWSNEHPWIHNLLRAMATDTVLRLTGCLDAELS